MAWSSREAARPSHISTGSSAGVLIVEGVFRSKRTLLACGASASFTLGGSGMVTISVLYLSSRWYEAPFPVSLSMGRKSGSQGLAR